MSKSEKGFEDAIEASLLGVGGYLRSEPSHFDRVLGLDTAELFAFIGATQIKAWEQLLSRGYGNDANAAQKGFAKRLASEIDARGTVDQLVFDSVRIGYGTPSRIGLGCDNEHPAEHEQDQDQPEVNQDVLT